MQTNTVCMRNKINFDMFKYGGISIQTYISKQSYAMLRTHKFSDDNPDENVDSRISELAAHNSNLEKKLDFPAK